MRIIGQMFIMSVLCVLCIPHSQAQDVEAPAKRSLEYHYSVEAQTKPSNYLTIHTDYELNVRDSSCDDIIKQYRSGSTGVTNLAAQLCTTPGVTHGYVGRYRLHLELAPLFDPDAVVEDLVEKIRNRIQTAKSGQQILFTKTELPAKKSNSP